MIVTFLSEWDVKHGFSRNSYGYADMPVMAKAADILDKLGVSYEMTIISAHRNQMFLSMPRQQRKKGSR